MKKPKIPVLATMNAADGADKALLKAIVRETDRLLRVGVERYSRYGVLFDVRYALWDGQNDEGTKETEDAFPWPGASDTRVRLADRIIKERKRIRKTAFEGKRLQAKPIRGVNAGEAQLVNTLLRWMIYTQARPMVMRECELGWSYMDTYGSAVMGCFWKRRTQLQPQEFDMDALMQLAQQHPEMHQLLLQLADPLMDDQTADGLKKMYPDNSIPDIKRMLRELRTYGKAELTTAYICKNEINWLAMRPGIDVFFDAVQYDLQDAPIITCRELLTEADLRERENSEGWSGDFIEEACKHKGMTSFDAAIDPLRLVPRGMAGFRGVMTEYLEERIEILRSFYYVHEKGTSALYQTIYHRSVNDVAALHELHGYDHGLMPFVAWRSETEERPILESRGIPEICMTWQTEQKVERDFYTDRLSMEILPTLLTPANRVGSVLMGPGQQLERSRTQPYEFLGLPPMSPLNERAAMLLEREICEYFGRFHADVDPMMTQIARQELANDTLSQMTPLVGQSWQLMQQFLTDEEIQQVAGPLAQSVPRGTKDIQGQYHWEFSFDVRTLDTEFINTVISAVQQIIPMDRMGVIDLSGLVGFLMHAISPDLAEQFVKPAQAAQMAEATDELTQLTWIANGIEPPLKEGSNAQLRLQVMQQVMQSPRYQELVRNDKTGVVTQLLENQQKKYQFQLQQQENAQIGKVGVKPVLGGAGDGLPSPAGIGMNGAMPQLQQP